MRALNRELVNAEHKQDGASVRDDLVTSLESQLLDYSSELVSEWSGIAIFEWGRIEVEYNYS